MVRAKGAIETGWHLLFEAASAPGCLLLTNSLSLSVSPSSPVDTNNPTFRTSDPLILPPKHNDNTAPQHQTNCLSLVSQVIKHRLDPVDYRPAKIEALMGDDSLIAVFTSYIRLSPCPP